MISKRAVIRAILVIAVLLLGVTVTATPHQGGLADSPWPMVLHDLQHTSRSPYSGPSIPGLKWSYAMGGGVGSPSIGSDGTIYAGSGDGKLYAINPNGTLRWSFATGGRISSCPAIASDGTIYTGSWDSKLYAINPNGSLKWSYIAEVVSGLRRPLVMMALFTLEAKTASCMP
ncbi:MAG: PQQ-like beta-propeller repeat protein [Anaerolineae bacterium]|nr:PQQ-like beta-propeller repeat protein [Anaerolineae bacterium]